MSKSPAIGLYSPPPDLNGQKDYESESELTDLEMELQSVTETTKKVEPDHLRDGVPVFTPTMAQFRDFEKFITAVNPWGMTHGIVKVIPPKEWLDQQPPLHEEVKKIKIKNPYIQEMNNQGSRGASGNFRQLNLSSNRTYNIVEWRALCDQLSRQPPAKRGETRRAPEKSANMNKKKTEPARVFDENESPSSGRMAKTITSKRIKPIVEEEISVNSRRNKYKQENNEIDEEAFKDFDYNLYEEFDDERCQELEVAYWKHISYAPPMYGGDMPGTLFTDKTKVWDLRNLPGFLNYLDEKVPGINTTYLYIGSWKSTFSWHLEDVDLYSINYLHFGAPKQWYSISQGDRERFEKAMASKWPEEFKDCNQFLRHKTFQISPAALWKEFKIKVNKIVHRPGEFMITFPYGYHAGYNLGYNCAEAVNFAVDEWIPIAEKAMKCDCAQQQDSVWVDLDSIRRKLPPTHKWYLGGSDEDNEEFDEIEDDDHLTDMLTPPHSGSEVKIPASRKRKTTAEKPEKRQVKRRVSMKSSEEPPCILCPNSNFELIETDTGKRAHRICGEYIPETSVIDGIVRDTKFISKARMGLKCIYCRSKTGACFQCSAAKCTRAYHATCAAASGVLVQKVWVSSFSKDGTEYKEEVYDFRCRFHRPRRDKKLDEIMLSIDDRTRQFGSGLKLGDICQAQFLCSDIFAGIVVANNHTEDMIRLKVLFDNTNTHYEIEYKWLLVPPLETSLSKPSANAIPMPISFKAKETLNTCARQADDMPRSCDPFGQNLTWAEFVSKPLDLNPDQVRVDFSKGCQIWYYIGKTSTEAKAHYTDDIKKPWDNPKGNFLNTLPKPVSNPSRNQCKGPYHINRPVRSDRSPKPRSTCIKLNLSSVDKSSQLKTRNKNGRSKLASTTKLSQSPQNLRKQHNEKCSQVADSQTTTGLQSASISQTAGLNKTIYPRNPLSTPNLSTPTILNKKSSLVLTQPIWPPIGLANSTVSGPHEHLAYISTSLSSSTFHSKQEKEHPVKSSSPNHHNITSSPTTNRIRPPVNLSALGPLIEYKYLQVEHNRDPGDYKSPYRTGGGFMNGYENLIDCREKNYQMKNSNNNAVFSSTSSKISTSSPFEDKVQLETRQAHNRDKDTINLQKKDCRSVGTVQSSLQAYRPSPPERQLQMEMATKSNFASKRITARPAGSRHDVACLNHDSKNLGEELEGSMSACDISKQKLIPQQGRDEELNSIVSYPHARNEDCNLLSKYRKSENLNQPRTNESSVVRNMFTNQIKPPSEPNLVSSKHDQILTDLSRNPPIGISPAQSNCLPSISSLNQLYKKPQRPILCHNQPNIPDVPPDTSSLIEKMMKNLRKASNEVWNTAL